MELVLTVCFGQWSRIILEMVFATGILHKSCITIKEMWNSFFPRPIEKIGVVSSVMDQEDSRSLPNIEAAGKEARPTTGQAELGGQVRSQAGAWERGKNQSFLVPKLLLGNALGIKALL